MIPIPATVWYSGVVQRHSGEPMRMLRPWLRGFGGTSVLDETARSGQVGALGQDVLDFADVLGVARALRLNRL